MFSMSFGNTGFCTTKAVLLTFYLLTWKQLMEELIFQFPIKLKNKSLKNNKFSKICDFICEGRLLLKLHEYRYAMAKHYPLLPSPQKKKIQTFSIKYFTEACRRCFVCFPSPWEQLVSLGHPTKNNSENIFYFRDNSE